MTNVALGRTETALLVNKSGGALAQGDVVIIDTANAAAITTTTTSAYVAGRIGVVIEPNGIANNDLGLVAFSGFVSIINLSGTGSIGDMVKTHSVAKQGVRHTAPMVAGDFAQVLGTTATPAALLFGSVNPGAGSSDADAIHDNVSAEISAVTEKTTLVADDLFLIEDSAAANVKKRAKYGTIAKFTDYSGISTVAGWAATPTVQIYVSKIGRMVTVQFYITGTSNAVSSSFTVPDIFATGFNIVVIPIIVTDNGVTATAMGRIRLTGGSATVALDKAANGSNGWTASGTKTIDGTFVYITD